MSFNRKVSLLELEKVKKNEELLNELKTFLKKNKKNKKSFRKDKWYDGFQSFLDNEFKKIFNDNIERLSNIYNVEENLLRNYFKLDKDFLEYVRYGFIKDEYIYIEELNNDFNIFTIIKLYGKRNKKHYVNPDVQLFLEKNSKYLPISTQNYIEKNIKHKKLIPEIEEITNEFQMSIFENTLPDNFQKKMMSSYSNYYIEKPNKNNEIKDAKLKTIFYFINIILRKYKNPDMNIVYKIYKSFINELSSHLYSTNPTFYKELIEDSKKEEFEKFFDTLIDISTEIRNELHLEEKFIWTLENLTNKEDKLFKVRELKDNRLNKSMKIFGLFEYKVMDDKLKETIIKEIDRQFYIKNPHLIYEDK